MSELLTVIVPVFNEQQCVPLFYERLCAGLKPIEGIDVEVLFMNNRSTDGTADAVRALREKDPRVQLITLAKNVGYQASILTGLRLAQGDYTVIIDVDCEDPPELIGTFVKEARAGADLVYGLRQKRPEAGWLTLMRRIFYRLNRLIADSEIVLDMAEFSLMTRALREAVISSKSTFPFVRAEVAAAGFERKGIAYDRGARVAGSSHYNLLRMTSFAIAGILSSTTFPLRAALYALALVAPLNVAWLVASVALASDRWFAQLVVVDLMYVCTFVAFVSLYIARTYRNVTGRPIANVDWRKSATHRTGSAAADKAP